MAREKDNENLRVFSKWATTVGHVLFSFEFLAIGYFPGKRQRKVRRNNFTKTS